MASVKGGHNNGITAKALPIKGQPRCRDYPCLGSLGGWFRAMRRSRWLAPWKDSLEKPAIYHCISRVVDRRFVLGDEERGQFRKFMRMQENFSGCRVPYPLAQADDVTCSKCRRWAA